MHDCEEIGGERERKSALHKGGGGEIFTARGTRVREMTYAREVGKGIATYKCIIEFSTTPTW